MNEEEKEAIITLIDSSNISLIRDGTIVTENKTINIILNLIDKLQKENKELEKYLITQNCEINRLNLEKIREERTDLENYKLNYIPKSKIEELIYQLEKDEENITKKYKEGKGINCYLSNFDRIRIRAYRTKTKEIKERIKKLLENN